jgi:hypothetical protein
MVLSTDLKVHTLNTALNPKETLARGRRAHIHCLNSSKVIISQLKKISSEKKMLMKAGPEATSSSRS